MVTATVPARLHACDRTHSEPSFAAQRHAAKRCHLRVPAKINSGDNN